MEDARLWSFEESLWTEGPDNYREKVDPEVVMVLPRPPFVLSGSAAIDAVADTPVWDRAELTERQVSRPQEGLIVIGYHVAAHRGDEHYEAHCTSVIRRLEHEVWRVVQHQQTPVLARSTSQA
ncbi:nuclear transport factor 2 family protein [Sphingomonas sanguinis]|uniref:nuclear transport factor 2 family protein n=1 Tax=Sphingomonas sp. LC-1 TaxID=3110957 RepID=UPI0021BB01D2|nr:nuclear transport factor 2 family protein [Sphingomonas sp. LC-1]MCT8002330.1 nuclear transport factor 2 family protein [Sphingomonas sp. LC-1]